MASNKSASSRGLLYYSDDSNNSQTSNKSRSQDVLEEEYSNENKQNNSMKAEPKNKSHSHVQKFPPVAVKEKVIFCIDNSLDISEGYTFENCSPRPNNPIAIRNEAISMFIRNKSIIACQTEFGVISVEPGAVKWLSHVHSDIAHSLKAVSDMQPVDADESYNIDLTSIFDCVFSEVNIPEYNLSTCKCVPPNYIIRIILVFGNCNLGAEVNFEDPSYTKFIKSSCCFLDVIYLHEKANDSNKVSEIYKSFGKIVTNDSYLFECSRDVVRVFNTMSKLIAHPLQRVEQDNWGISVPNVP